MAYVKLSDIDFAKPEHRTICEELYKDIHSVEAQLLADEALAESLKSSIGQATAEGVTSHFISFNRRILLGLKIAFWYYTGKVSNHVIAEIDEENEIDIFNPR